MLSLRSIRIFVRVFSCLSIIFHRVLGHAVFDDLPVHMRACRTAGAAGEGDGLAAANVWPRLDGDLAVVLSLIHI